MICNTNANMKSDNDRGQLLAGSLNKAGSRGLPCAHSFLKAFQEARVCNGSFTGAKSDQCSNKIDGFILYLSS